MRPAPWEEAWREGKGRERMILRYRHKSGGLSGWEWVDVREPVPLPGRGALSSGSYSVQVRCTGAVKRGGR